MTDLQKLKADYEKLEDGERILFLEWLHHLDPWKWDFATQCPPLRKFHDGKLKREEK